MADEKALKRKAARQSSTQVRRDKRAADKAQKKQPEQERRFVDIDPWAVLLEQLMETPEEGAPAERKPSTRASRAGRPLPGRINAAEPCCAHRILTPAGTSPSRS